MEEPESLGSKADPPYDVIVMSLPEPDEEGAGLQMLAKFPASRVLALRGDASRAFLYEMRPHCTPLGEISPQTLRDAIHGSGNAAGGMG